MDFDVADWMTAPEAIAWTLSRDADFASRMRFAGYLSLVSAARRIRDRWALPIDAAAPTLKHKCEQGHISVTGKPMLLHWPKPAPRIKLRAADWRDVSIDVLRDFILPRTTLQSAEWRDLAFLRLNMTSIFPNEIETEVPLPDSNFKSRPHEVQSEPAGDAVDADFLIDLEKRSQRSQPKTAEINRALIALANAGRPVLSLNRDLLAREILSWSKANSGDAALATVGERTLRKALAAFKSGRQS